MTVFAEITAGSKTVLLERAGLQHVAGIVNLLADDPVSASRGDTGLGGIEHYLAAFEQIDADPGHLLVVGTIGGAVLATMQLSWIPGLARRGATRAQIESLHVDASLRGAGLGAAMVTWAIDEARRRDCGLVQLTSDKTRAEAHRFYERLGFTASHEGFKLLL